MYVNIQSILARPGHDQCVCIHFARPIDEGMLLDQTFFKLVYMMVGLVGKMATKNSIHSTYMFTFIRCILLYILQLNPVCIYILLIQ